LTGGKDKSVSPGTFRGSNRSRKRLYNFESEPKSRDQGRQRAWIFPNAKC
jgi:hypothetical protein